MTLILGIEDPARERSIVCADSGMWEGDLVDTLVEPKLWTCGAWVVGAAGELGAVQAVRWGATAHAFRTIEDRTDVNALENCVGVFAERAFEVLAQFAERCRRVDPSRETKGPHFVVAWGRYVWEVGEGCVVRRIGGFGVAGMMTPAIAALAMSRARDAELNIPFDAFMTAERVQRVVADVTSCTRPPWHWCVTRGGNVCVTGAWKVTPADVIELSQAAHRDGIPSRCGFRLLIVTPAQATDLLEHLKRERMMPTSFPGFGHGVFEDTIEAMKACYLCTIRDVVVAYLDRVGTTQPGRQIVHFAIDLGHDPGP